MGCCHVMKNNHEVFKEIMWYSERWDKRLGFVFLVQNAFAGQLGSVLDPQNLELFKRKDAFFRHIFSRSPDVAVMILKVGETLRVVDSRLSPQLPKTAVFLCLEGFVKDLDDEVNVRRLKGIPWTPADLWQIIYTAVVVCAVLEENNLRLGAVKRENFVFVQSRFKYFCRELFAPAELAALIRDDRAAVFEQFELRRRELVLGVLSVALKLPEPPGTAGPDALIAGLFAQLESPECPPALPDGERAAAIDAPLCQFVKEVLWQNALQFRSFEDLRAHIQANCLWM